jgi:hypothetical protein
MWFVGAIAMNDHKTSNAAPTEDADATAATIAVALAAAAERMVPVAGADLTQPSTAPEEAHAPTEAASHTGKEQHR